MVAIAAAFAMLAFILATGVADITERDSAVSSLTFAVTGDMEQAKALVTLVSSMTDIAAYANFVAMDTDSAKEALQKGEVSAVMELPDNFVDGIQNGSNEALLLHLPSSSPVEGYLALYAGQVASDMLSAAQGAIYLTLNTLRDEGMYDSNSVVDVNRDYVVFALGRNGMYEEDVISAAGSASLTEHYTASLLVFVLLMSALTFYPILSPVQGAWRNRLRTLGCDGFTWTLAAFTCIFICIAVLISICLFYTQAFNFGAFCTLLTFSLGFVCLTATVCRTESAMSALCFLSVLIFALLGGGIIPTTLMPVNLRNLSPLSPYSALMDAMHGEFSPIIVLCGLLFSGIAFMLCTRAYSKGERI